MLRNCIETYEKAANYKNMVRVATETGKNTSKLPKNFWERLKLLQKRPKNSGLGEKSFKTDQETTERKNGAKKRLETWNNALELSQEPRKV